MNDPDCLFCRIVLGDIPAKRVYEDDAVIAFNDIAPQAPIHVLVVPRLHLVSISELERHDGLAARLFHGAVAVARQLGIDDAGRGFRLVVNRGAEGGQSVDHLHVHLLGGRRLRWGNDGAA